MIPEGFEPSTYSLEGCCSIQLSYGTGMLRFPMICESESTTKSGANILNIVVQENKFYIE